MAATFDGPPAPRPGSRRVSELLPPGLVSRARRHSGQGAVHAPSRAEETERVLRSAVEALIGLVQRTPGFDVTVSVGPGNGPAVRLRYTKEGLVAHRLNARGRAAAREEVGSVFSESEIVSELASLLWSGEVEPR